MMFVLFFSYYDWESIFMVINSEQLRELQADKEAYRIDFLLCDSLEYPKSVLKHCFEELLTACYIESDIEAFKNFLKSRGVEN